MNMRRSATITLAIMGGGLMTLGALEANCRHAADRDCRVAQSRNANAPCTQSNSSATGGGGYGRSTGSTANGSSEASSSTRGGFGASAAGHAGE